MYFFLGIMLYDVIYRDLRSVLYEWDFLIILCVNGLFVILIEDVYFFSFYFKKLLEV